MKKIEPCISQEEKDKLAAEHDKHGYRSLFCSRYSLSDQDLEAFTDAFHKFGMRNSMKYDGKGYSNSTAAHYYFQGIIEHFSLDWAGYGSKMPEDARQWMQDNFPKLVGVNDISPSCF